VREVDIVERKPPAQLLEACPEPSFSGSTYRDVLVLTAELQAALEDCDSKLFSIREFYGKTLK